MLKQDDSQVAAMSRLFSSSVIQEMARYGASPTFSRLVKESCLLALEGEIKNVGNLMDVAFSFLQKKKFRYEYIYKAALTHNILIGVHRLKASLITEFRVGKCKADIVILNGTGTVYEIKTDRDSLSRLTNQIDSYMKVFALVNVIVGEHHINSVLNVLPEEIGVYKLTERYHISEERKGEIKPERTCPLAIFDSIQLKEAKMLLETLGVEIPNVPNTRLYSTLRSRFEELDPEDTHCAMVETLKKTRNLVALEKFIRDVPRSLQAAVLSTPLRKQDYPRILEAINTPVQDALMWV